MAYDGHHEEESICEVATGILLVGCPLKVSLK
jgi:hypothetical protein